MSNSAEPECYKIDLYNRRAPIILPDIQLILRKTEGKWLLSILGAGVYVNNYYKEGKEILLEKGDEISYLDHTLKIFEKEIIATEGLVKASLLSKVHTSRYGFYDDYPDFHRSPRIIYRVLEEKIAVNAPPEVPKKPTDGIIKVILPPLIMLTVTILMAILMPKQGLYTIATAATTVMTVIFSISSSIKTRKEHKQEIINRRESYGDYLSKKAVEIHEVNREQKNGRLYHYLGILELLEMGKMYHHRIYVKIPLHFDFLYYRLGLGELDTSSEITYS